MMLGLYVLVGWGGLNVDVISGCWSDNRIVLEYVYDDK